MQLNDVFMNEKQKSSREKISFLKECINLYLFRSDLINICMALNIKNGVSIADRILTQVNPQIPGKISYAEFLQVTGLHDKIKQPSLKDVSKLKK